MPLSMVTSYDEITQEELGVLQRQYQKSFFYLNKSTETPTKLAIFDFDSTLFFSPLLSPTIWHPSLIRVATAESVYGPGWWRDIRSLDLGPFEELKKNAWKGYWNEGVVQQARDCIKDKDTMTVVLTGRRYHPFHVLVPAMLEAKGLQFDLIGLRPDPEVVSDNQWEVKKGQHKITYNLTSSVFKSTMHFKTCFILNLIHNIPSINNVTMWDDRIHHVKRFQEYLDILRDAKTIKGKGNVVYVPGIRPKYNPTWEKNVIHHIIETHNKALTEHIEGGVNNGKCEQRITWPDTAATSAVVEDPLSGTAAETRLQLVPMPAATVIQLSAECQEKLREAFEPCFKEQLESNKQWKGCGGEEPQYFGDCVYLSQNVLESDAIDVGPIGSVVGVSIKAYSKSAKLSCLILKVEVDGHTSNDYILPLWFKPSEYYEVFKLRDVAWCPISADMPKTITGKVDYAYRLGIVEKITEKRRRSSAQKEDNNSKRTKH